MMPLECLLAVLPKAVGRAVDDDLVVAGLEGDGFAVGVRAGAGEGEHVGFDDSLDGDADAVFPDHGGAVVGGGVEAAGGVDEGKSVDGACLYVLVAWLGRWEW